MKVQFEVEPALWREVKSEAALQGQKLNKFVDGVLRNALPYSKVSKISVPVMAETKTDSGSVQAVSRVRTGGSTPPTEAIDESPVAEMRCFKCKTKVQKWTMDARGKPWCDDCLEDARNAIP